MCGKSLSRFLITMGVSRKSPKMKPDKKGDRSFKEIKRQISKRNRKIQEEDIIETV